MSFVCKTVDCAISISGASFPVAMNCPVCQQLLSEKIENNTLTEIEELIIQRLPYTIAYPLKRSIIEKYPWAKINLLKDTFLNYLKYLGLIIASEFFNSSLKDKKMVALFNQSLAEPSFGSWNHFIRETIKFLKANNHNFFCKELVEYYDAIETGKKRKLYKGEIQYIDENGDIQIIKQEATGIGMLINFRNLYLGHGLTLDEKDSMKLWNNYYPIFLSLLEQMEFAQNFRMYKFEHGDSYLLKTAELLQIDKGNQKSSRVWIENSNGETLEILPFFIVPGEVSLTKEDKEQLFTYESYTGRTIKFFSPEGTEKQTSGKILEKLNLLLREKQKETPFTPEDFTKDEFSKRIAEENKLLLDTLIAEKKVIHGVYQHREDIEIKLREWIGAKASIFFIVAEAGSGKTNLLVEIQKQYAERELPSLLIRAGRMEKQSLQKQIAYLLNIDLDEGLENYTSISGTQAQPTFILIDGLNEANNAEEIWQEIIDLSKIFETGSLKFVVTSRANTKAELNRYSVAEKDQDLLFGEKKDNEEGLGAYAFWLTALDMKEMKGAWGNYATKDKAKFKPQFNFDAISEFDRGLYNQINNPLILRLFLEIYNGKALPNKGVMHLNIWHDWLRTFSTEEQIFLKLVANEVWQKGENELLLDDLLKHETLKPYFTSDIINAPYNRLKNNGWISRYVKDLNGYVGFTIEASLLYLMAIQLKEQTPPIDLAAVKTISTTHSKLQKSAIEVFLCEQALNGELNLVVDLIDAGNDSIDFSTKPLLLYLKTHGVNSTIEKVLANSTENDWLALNKLDGQLEELQLHVLRKEYLEAVMPRNEFKTKYAIALGLSAIAIFDKEDAIHYLSKIDTEASLLTNEARLLSQLGDCEYKFGEYDKALVYYEMCMAIDVKSLGEDNPDSATTYNKIGRVLECKGEYDQALDYYHKCLAFRLKSFGGEHYSLASPYNNIGSIWEGKGEFKKALKYYKMSFAIDLRTLGESHNNIAISYNNFGSISNEIGEYANALDYFYKCLSIQMNLFGELHLNTARTYNNIGFTFDHLGDYNKALKFFQKCLDIELKTLGDKHPNIARAYNNIGYIWNIEGKYDKALEYYEMSLAIRLKTLGLEHPSVATSYNNIGLIWDKKGDYDKALDYYEKCLAIELKTLGLEHPSVATSYNNIGSTFDDKGEHDKALEYYEKSLAISLKTLGVEHPSVATSYNNIGLIWDKKGEYDKAIEYYEMSLAIRLKSLGLEHPSVATSYNNIGSTFDNKGEHDKALNYYEKCLAIELKTLGVEHPSVASSYNNIGSTYNNKGEYDKALDYYKKCLSIRLKSLGGSHPDVANAYNIIGAIWDKKGEYDKALDFYQMCLSIRLKTFGGEHPSVANSYYNIGCCYHELSIFGVAIEFYLKGFNALKKGGFPFKIAKCYEALGNKVLALDYFIKSAEIRKNDSDAGLYDESTMDAVQNVLRIAKDLRKETVLPEWIKNQYF